MTVKVPYWATLLQYYFHNAFGTLDSTVCFRLLLAQGFSLWNLMGEINIWNQWDLNRRGSEMDCDQNNWHKQSRSSCRLLFLFRFSLSHPKFRVTAKFECVCCKSDILWLFARGFPELFLNHYIDFFFFFSFFKNNNNNTRLLKWTKGHYYWVNVLVSCFGAKWNR